MEATRRLFFEGKVQVMELIHDHGAPPHTHDYLELAFIKSGTAFHSISDVMATMAAGDFFVVDYHTPHTYASTEGITIVNCLFRPELIDHTLAGIGSFNELVEQYFYRITGRKINGPASNQIFHDSGKIAPLIDRLVEEYTHQDNGYMEVLRCTLRQIVIEITRQVGSLRKESDLTRRILEQIEQRYSEPLILADLCRAYHYSLPYVSSRFKEETGISFTQMLQNRRMEESCRLLIETNDHVAHIAGQVGYNSVKFFNQVFKRTTGMTPRTYRQQHE